jgi:NAD(P)-dependent dehydrogenase (short-subunit alcohol dehydrogenase family)
MKDLAGRVAVVTGSGSGIGEALALALAGQGMHVAVSDIEEAQAVRVARAVSEKGVRALAVRTDVSDAQAVESLAAHVYAELGACHVLCNNAGVLLFGGVADKRLDDWNWVLGVNLYGVVHGLQAFLPRMLEQGGEAHIVNTASVAALGGSGIYGASKAAVLSLSETLAEELTGRGIGVSVLCPSYVNSKILDAQRNRPARFGARAAEPFGTATVTTGLDASAVAEDAIAAIREGRLYVFTHPEPMSARPRAVQRFEALLAAMDAGLRPKAG